MIYALCSLIIVGLGQVLKGQILRGICLFVVFCMLCSSGIGLLFAIPLYIWQIFDAGK